MWRLNNIVINLVWFGNDLRKRKSVLASNLAKKNIGEGTAAPSFSVVGPIWLGCRLEQKTAQKACAAMSFSLFSLNLDRNCWWWWCQSISFENPIILIHNLPLYVFKTKRSPIFIWWQYITKPFDGSSVILVKMMSNVSFVNLAIKKVIFSVLIASKINNFKMLPLYEVEIWTIIE